MGMGAKRTKQRSRGLRIERLELRDLFAGDPINGLGVLGDALSDEYFDQLIGVGASWVQVLQSGRQLATGPTGAWGEPRRTGFEYNWSRKGATSSDLQAQGQTQGLLGQIASGDVTHAVLMIGTEDFGLDKPTYQSLINGTLPPSQIDTLVNQITDRLDTALADLRFSNAKILLVNLADESLTPAARSFTPSAVTRDRVSVVIDRINANLRDLANAHHVPLLDLHGLESRLLGTNSQPINSWRVGGVTITNTSGTAATNAFVVDGITPHTITQTVISNLMLTGLNLGYDAGLAILTEAEMLAQSGLTFQGQNTLGINYADYVILPRLPFYLDYGSGIAADDFSQRVTELTNRLGVAAPTAGEIAGLKTSI
jgi:lysophospholipase L1-like esterase